MFALRYKHVYSYSSVSIFSTFSWPPSFILNFLAASLHFWFTLSLIVSISHFLSEKHFSIHPEGRLWQCSAIIMITHSIEEGNCMKFWRNYLPRSFSTLTGSNPGFEHALSFDLKSSEPANSSWVNMLCRRLSPYAYGLLERILNNAICTKNLDIHISGKQCSENLQYRSWVTWQTSASSKEVTRAAWMFMHGCKRRPRCASASEYPHAHLWIRMGHGPIIAPTRQWWQDRDSRLFARLSYFLMNTDEFAEWRVVVEDSLGINKLRILCIFSWRVSSTRECDREHCHPLRHETFRKL